MTEQEYIKTLDVVERVATTLILPVAIVIATNWWSKRQRKNEQDFELNKLKESKKIDSEHVLSTEKKNHDKTVHASLIKVLFQVQKLHISVSGSCVDNKCIDDAINEFNDSLQKYQTVISDNQLYLSSKTTNNIYKFYGLVGDLLIELREIRDKKLYELAIACVWENSQKLADCILDIQDEIIKKRKDLTEEFNKLEVPNFRDCCGQRPSDDLMNRMNDIRSQKIKIESQLENLPDNLLEK